MNQTVTATDINGNTYEVLLSKLRWRPSAYGIVIKDDCLLVAPQFGKYDLPGGGIELGETIEQGLLREIKEETGVIVAANPRLITCRTSFFVLPGSSKGEYVESLMFYYACDFVSGELTSDGFTEDEKPNMSMPEWLPLAQLNDIKAGGSVDWRTIVQDVIATKS